MKNRLQISKPTLPTDKPKNESAIDINLGSYVIASRFRDYDPFDPWRVGFIVRKIETWNPNSPGCPTFGYIIGNADGTWQDNTEYKHCKQITQEEGKDWLDKHRNLQ